MDEQVTIRWSEPRLPPINLHVLPTAYQFYSKRKSSMKARLMDVMGDDLRVVDAARVSFAKESQYISSSYEVNTNHRLFDEWLAYAKPLEIDKKPTISLEDYALIQYLGSHGHWTPFAHPQITLRMKAPVPIRTQCFKHKQGFVENEESRRYISGKPELYVPTEFRSAPKNAKQGSAGTHEHNKLWMDTYKVTCKEAIEIYQQMIEDGVAPEQARLVLPQGVQVQWIWTGSLAAFARFTRQRKDPHAQEEIQELAQEVDDCIRPFFPVAWRALVDG